MATPYKFGVQVPPATVESLSQPGIFGPQAFQTLALVATQAGG